MTPLDVPLGILAVAFALALVRIARGPSLADRVIAAELAFAVLLSGLGLIGARLESPSAIVVAAVGALLQFVATVTLAGLILRPDIGAKERQ